MRGAGEPFFEHHFPPGMVQIGEIMRGPQPGARMKFELATHLYGWDPDPTIVRKAPAPVLDLSPDELT
ncbi:uncharacterized protein ASPGLDRAFT_45431 [Aspergillus glaucus CBS 516.65]|uniref:Uncharacterized protein n=1 Tax=Aspergillus glaucus CBS 516.65 TaxID=1160497 RepID=A0A1L9VNL7_ASPGL|nr:hypothetical protein ASPGLDRAFT_45431 [Aspergillus glaucus CBS 516.65]OJJ85471.1 hypothetical protein ASPGLDRAFT_45431 [Aspergillus glaucus CBS 516.65]